LGVSGKVPELAGTHRRGRLCPFFVPGDNVLSVQKLNELLQPLVEDLGFEFIGLEYNSNPKHAILRVYIDAENGVDIEDCALVSRETAALLDVKDPIRSQYNLEVSSPGLDRPLFTPAHYIEFTGCDAQINTFAPQDGRRKFSGPILGANEDAVRIEQDGVEVTLDFDNIAKARLVPDYDSILAGHKSNQ
jgi:ribosome maturation factor RimP